MDLLGIEGFLDLAACGRCSEAAGQRHAMQPALGRRIRWLEHWIGMASFGRSSRRVLPTEAGRASYRAAENALRRLTLARLHGREVGNASAMAIRLASMHLRYFTCFPRWFPAVEPASGHDVHTRFLVDSTAACERRMWRGPPAALSSR